MEDLGVQGIQGIQEGVEEAKENVFRLKDYLMSQIPTVTKFCINVVMAMLAFWIGRKLIHLFIRLLWKSFGKKYSTSNKGAVQFTLSLIKASLYLLLISTIVLSLGFDVSSVAALLGTAGVAIGLALQGSLTNVAGGVILLVAKPFQVGDYIRINTEDGTEGVVSKIDMCYTTLTSVDNKHIVVPNGTLSNCTLTNVTAQEKRRLEIKVGITYDSDLKKAKRALTSILQDDYDTKTDEEYLVYVDELGENAVILGIRVWVDTAVFWQTKWRLNEEIKLRFDDNGIIIAYPQIDVHMK